MLSLNKLAFEILSSPFLWLSSLSSSSFSSIINSLISDESFLSSSFSKKSNWKHSQANFIIIPRRKRKKTILYMILDILNFFFCSFKVFWSFLDSIVIFFIFKLYTKSKYLTNSGFELFK